jgi:acyl-CoA thioester hydrolase
VGITLNAFQTVIKVIFRDLDPLEHVNNAVYFTYMEVARTEYYMQLTGARSLGEIRFIIARASCDFRAPAKFGDRLLVAVWPSEVGTSSFKLQYRITQERDDTLVAEGETVQVAFDYEARKTIPLPDAVKRLLVDERSKALGNEGSKT